MHPQSIADRLWSKVKFPSRIGTDECWNFCGFRDKDGYGEFQVENKHYRAHRLSYELNSGPIPDGLYVLHTCDNPSCCNPSHLFLGSQLDNIRDMVKKGRRAQARGEEHSSSKLTSQQALYIRLSTESLRVLANKFGVTQGTIGHIRAGRTWKHLK